MPWPFDRPRCRYLAQTHAALHALARAARRDDVDQCRAGGSARCRPALLDVGPSPSDQGCGGRARKCSASSCECGDQEGAVPRGRAKIGRGSNKVRPFFGHDYHFHVRLVCPPGERLLSRCGICGVAGRWLRPRIARLLVFAWHPASAPAAWSGAAAPGADAGRSARGHPHRVPLPRRVARKAGFSHLSSG